MKQNYIKTRRQRLLSAAALKAIKPQTENHSDGNLQLRSTEDLMERVGPDDKEDDAASDAFFAKVEATFTVKIPAHIKAMLKFHGFGNRIAYARIQHSDLNEIQRFAREELASVLRDDEDVIYKYYGPFSSCTNRFTICNGERKLLLRIRQEVRRHSLDYR